jgi:hypothetical protein
MNYKTTFIGSDIILTILMSNYIFKSLFEVE